MTCERGKLSIRGGNERKIREEICEMKKKKKRECDSYKRSCHV